jgi:hypothetical protein
LAKAADLGHAHAGLLFLPSVEGLFGNAKFTADIENGCATLGLVQGVSDLLVGKLRFLRGSSRVVKERILADF